MRWLACLTRSRLTTRWPLRVAERKQEELPNVGTAKQLVLDPTLHAACLVTLLPSPCGKTAFLVSRRRKNKMSTPWPAAWSVG
jgi:hypothetical protein